jgi:hypothetical protein
VISPRPAARAPAREATREFPARLDSIPAARHFAAEHIDSAAAPTVANDVIAIVSELASNALLHSQHAFSLTVSQATGSVRIGVRDSSPALPARRRREPTEVGGWGLFLVDALARRWGTELVDGGKLVWAELPG